MMVAIQSWVTHLSPIPSLPPSFPIKHLFFCLTAFTVCLLHNHHSKTELVEGDVLTLLDKDDTALFKYTVDGPEDLRDSKAGSGVTDDALEFSCKKYTFVCPRTD